jgi:hypothetical protein
MSDEGKRPDLRPGRLGADHDLTDALTHLPEPAGDD